jgi:mRNA degradation ribonuclease J1/J2/transcriptional regulator with XRE-family HTH domain
LDFGMSFGRRDKYYEEFLNPRTSNGIGDFLATGLIPDISGVYREDLMLHLGRKAEEPDIQGVVLSHAHADHANYISFLHKKIPIYCGETCKYIIEAIKEQSQRTMENEVLDFKKRPIFKSEYRNPPIKRKFNTFRTGDKFKIDSLEIEPVHVDHCLAEDTIVQLSDGELIKVKDVDKSSYINTIDFENGNNVNALAKKSKHLGRIIYKIKTSFGEIESTGEHIFYILDGLDIIEKKAKELEIGDFLIRSRKIDFIGKKQELPHIHVRRVAKVSKKGLEVIKQKRREMRLTQKDLAKKVGLSKFYGEFERGKNGIEIRRLNRILESLDIDINTFSKKFISYKKGITIPKETSESLLQLLGYVIGDGSWYFNSNNSPYLEIGDKDKKNLDLYKKLAKSVFNNDPRIVKKHTNILYLSTYVGKLFYQISPHVFSKAYTRKIPKIVHMVPLNELAAFLRGIYDAEGCFRTHTIVLTSTSKDIIETTRLLLLRFGILSWIYEFIEPNSKRKAYQLNITHNESLHLFIKNIGFGSKAKQKKLEDFLKENKKSKIEQLELIPFNGNYLKDALNKMKISTWDFQKGKTPINHYTNGKHYPSKNKMIKILKFLKKCNKGNEKEKVCFIKKIEKILSENLIFSPIKSIQHKKGSTVVYDFEVPGYSSFLANGFLVHNSVPGAYGAIIHTSEGPVIYTGDLRMHGTHKEMTDDFIAAAKKEKPIAMITEGTRIDTGQTNESEVAVYQKSRLELEKNKKLSIVDFNFKDVDRFTTFYKIAKDLGKTLVISFKHACYLERYHKDKKIKSPDSKDPNIMILKPKRLTGTYIDEDYTDYYIKKRLNYPNIITCEQIEKNPTKYMVVLNFWYFNMLVDLMPYEGTYVHSLSEPFNEEMEMSYDRMLNWLKLYKLRLVQSHCSGHISGADLQLLIEKINPKLLFPIHTEYPGMFRKLNIKTKMVKEGKTYMVK